MPTQEIAAVRPLSLARFLTVSLLLGILSVTLLIPFGLVAGLIGWAALWAWGGDQLSLLGLRSADMVAVAFLVAASLVVGVGIAHWVGTGPTLGTPSPGPGAPKVTRVLRPWWTLGGLLLASELIAGKASIAATGSFLTTVSILAFVMWLGATATWAAVAVTRRAAGAGWRFATQSMAGTLALAGMALAAVALWVGAGIAAVAMAPEAQQRLELAARRASTTAATTPPLPPGDDGAGEILLAAQHGPPGESSDPSDCLEKLTPALRRDAQRIARGQSVSWEDAEDLVQDVALDVCAQHPLEFKSYFIRSVQNAARTWWKRERRRCPMPDEPPPSCELDPERQLITAEQDAIVRHMRCQLSVDDQEVIRLAVDEWLQDREIAQKLGINPAAARKRLSRATGRLREKVAEVCAARK